MAFNDVFLNKEQVEFVHGQTVALLEKRGVRYDHPDAVELFKKNGFRTEGDVVFINEAQVDAALKTCPETFEWQAREYSVQVDRTKGSLCGTCAGPTFMVDADHTVRRAELSDYINFCKLADSSDALQFVHNLLICTQGIESEREPYVQMANLLKYVDKPINLTAIQTTKESVGQVARKQIQMVKKFYGKEDGYVVVGGATPSSPLTFSQTDVEVIMAYIAEKQAVKIVTMSIPVISSHASLCSTLIQNNAEVLSGIVLTQLLEPGTPVIYAGTSTTTNLRTATAICGSPEPALLSAAIASLCKYYKLPFRASGCYTDAFQVDYQAGAESMLTQMINICSDIDMMQFTLGSMGSINAASLEKFVLDEDTLMMSKRMKQGIDIDMSIDYNSYLDEVEHGGMFLELGMPDEYFTEHISPKLFNKVDYDVWKMRNGKSLLENAEAEVQRRLADYKERTFDAAQMDVIKDFLV